MHSPTSEVRQFISYAQTSVDSSTFSSRPQSLLIDLSSISDTTDNEESEHKNEKSELHNNSSYLLRSLKVPNGVTTRERSHSNHNLSQNSNTAVSLGSYMVIPRTCSGSAVPSSSSHLHVTSSSACSNLSVSSSSARPHLIAQLSQTSESPSPVERDGGIWSGGSGNIPSVKADLNQTHGLSLMISSSSSSTAKAHDLERFTSMPSSTTTSDRSRVSPEKKNLIRKAPPCDDKSKQYLDTSTTTTFHSGGGGGGGGGGPQRNKLPYHSHSSPEFPHMTHMRVTGSDRTHSFDDLYSKRKHPPSQSPTENKVSPSRDKINNLTSQIYSSLDRNCAVTLSSYASDSFQILDTSASSELNPICKVLQKIILVATPLLNLDRAHIQTLMELSSCCNHPARSQEHRSMELSGCCNRSVWSQEHRCMELSGSCNHPVRSQEHRSMSLDVLGGASSEEEQVYDSPVAYLLNLGYRLVKKPLRVTFGIPLDRYMALTFRLVGDSPQTRDALLKVSNFWCEFLL